MDILLPAMSIGRAGEGPGEWPRVGQALLDGDELVVVARDRLFRYDESGAEIASGSFQAPDVLLHAQGSRLVAQAINTSGWALSETATEPRRVIDPPTDRVPEAEYGGCWRRDADDSHLYRLSCAAGRVQVVDYEGATVRWINLGDEPREATEAELDAYIERFWLLQSGGREMNPLVERQLTHIREEAAILPRWAALRVDRATGRLVLLEQPFGDAGDTEGVLHVVDPDGTHVLRIPTGRRIRDFAVHGDTLMTLARHPVTDEPWLALDLLPPSGSR